MLLGGRNTKPCGRACVASPGLLSTSEVHPEEISMCVCSVVDRATNNGQYSEYQHTAAGREHRREGKSVMSADALTTI
jgi:hypothetical protein